MERSREIRRGRVGPHAEADAARSSSSPCSPPASRRHPASVEASPCATVARAVRIAGSDDGEACVYAFDLRAGVELAEIAAFRRAAVGAKIVLVADAVSDACISLALRGGVDGVLLERMPPEEFGAALEFLLIGEKVFPAEFLGRIEFGTEAETASAIGAAAAA
jgi:DNA-binding NarL/FixJ family response regulator